MVNRNELPVASSESGFGIKNSLARSFGVAGIFSSQEINRRQIENKKRRFFILLKNLVRHFTADLRKDLIHINLRIYQFTITSQKIFYKFIVQKRIDQFRFL